jgi:hypothetical protein
MTDQGQAAPAVLTGEARGWLSDCVWADIAGDGIARLTAEQVTRAVARHYAGGLPAFMASGF